MPNRNRSTIDAWERSNSPLWLDGLWYKEQNALVTAGDDGRREHRMEELIGLLRTDIANGTGYEMRTL